MADETYAVAVRDGERCFLFMWVKRADKGDFYVFLPRPHDTSINAHASYHADGRYHVKTHGLPKIFYQQKQKPDATFAGTAHILDQTIRPSGPRSIGQECKRKDWSAVLEIPVSELADGRSRHTHVSADLVDDRSSPEFVPNARIICQSRYRDSSPYLVLTFYEMPPI